MRGKIKKPIAAKKKVIDIRFCLEIFILLSVFFLSIFMVIMFIAFVINIL